jgi:hypothetical protein
MDMDDDFLSDHFDDEDIFESYVTKILDAKYDEMTIDEVCKLQTHLTPQQQKELAAVMKKYPKVFGNDLGILIQMLARYIAEPILYPNCTRTPLGRNWNTL